MEYPLRRSGLKASVLRALTEAGFIIFLFYTNLVMGEFSHSGIARGRSLLWAIGDVFTATNFAIAVVAALVGYLIVEVLRRRLL